MGTTFCRYLHPRRSWCYQGEDMMRHVRQLAKHSTQGQSLVLQASKMLERYCRAVDHQMSGCWPYIPSPMKKDCTCTHDPTYMQRSICMYRSRHPKYKSRQQKYKSRRPKYKSRQQNTSPRTPKCIAREQEYKPRRSTYKYRQQKDKSIHPKIHIQRTEIYVKYTKSTPRAYLKYT